MSELEYIQQAISDEASEFVAGYVAHRYRSKHLSSGTPTKTLPFSHCPDWITHISKENFIYPSKKLLNATRVLEVIFNQFHGNGLSDQTQIFFKVAEEVDNNIDEHSKIPWEVLLCLVRTRTYIRLGLMNKQRKDACESIRIAWRSAYNRKFYT